MYCLQCKDYTGTTDLRIVEKTSPKMGTVYYLKATCTKKNCKKSRKLGKSLPTGYTIDSTADQLSSLLSNQKSEKTGLAILPEPAVIAATTGVNLAVQNENADGKGLGDIWNSIKNIGNNSSKKSFTDKLGDTAAQATKSLVRSIPVVGDLLVDSGVVDKGIDMFSEYVWQPVKKWFGGNSLGDEILNNIRNDDNALSDLGEKVMEMRIKSGDGIVPKYIRELRQGSEEDKTLASVLMKTVCKPKFYKFLKDESIPSTMSILEALTKYKSRSKPYKNQEEKSLNTLKELGYSCL